MAQQKSDTKGVDTLKASITAHNLGNLYIFHGEEHYLMEYYLDQVRKQLVDKVFAEFNYRRYSGHNLTVDELSAACDTLPAFSDRILIEVVDYDFSKGDDSTKSKLLALLKDLPDYICLIFIFDTLEWKLDGRTKIAEELKKQATIVEFAVQEQSKLIGWIRKHFASHGRSTDAVTAEYLAELTGGLMTSLNTEIEKLCSYTKENVITKAHIDAVVTPVMDAIVFRLTDNLMDGNYPAAAAVLTDLLNMREPPQLLIYSITMNLRQLLAARLCLERRLGEKDLMKTGAFKFDWLAKKFLVSARKVTLPECRQAVRLSTETAYQMVTVGEGDLRLTELLIKLASNRRKARR